MHIFVILVLLWLSQVPIILIGYGAFRLGELKQESKSKERTNDESLCCIANG
jgi:hypothetical protein